MFSPVPKEIFSNKRSVELYATPSLKVVGKTVAQNVEIAAHAKARTRYANSCAALKVSYVLNDKTSITLQTIK